MKFQMKAELWPQASCCSISVLWQWDWPWCPCQTRGRWMSDRGHYLCHSPEIEREWAVAAKTLLILSLSSLCCILHHAKYQRRHAMPVSCSCLATKQWLRETDILTRLAEGFLWTARGFGRACGSVCSDSKEASSLFLLLVLRSDT